MQRTILILLYVAVMLTTHEPPIMHEVRRRTKKLTKELGLWNADVMALKPNGPELGWNISKGWAMATCTEGSIDAIMHVMAHEVAHTRVDEYEHGDDFVKSFEHVKKTAQRIGVYNDATGEKLCGDSITTEES